MRVQKQHAMGGNRAESLHLQPPQLATPEPEPTTQEIVQGWDRAVLELRLVEDDVESCSLGEGNPAVGHQEVVDGGDQHPVARSRGGPVGEPGDRVAAARRGPFHGRHVDAVHEDVGFLGSGETAGMRGVVDHFRRQPEFDGGVSPRRDGGEPDRHRRTMAKRAEFDDVGGDWTGHVGAF